MAKTPGQRLSDRLAKLGWSQVRLATEIDADTTLVCRWINGTRTPTLKMAVRIARSAVRIPAEAWVEPSDRRA